MSALHPDDGKRSYTELAVNIFRKKLCKITVRNFKWFIPVVCESNMKYQKDIGWVRQTQQFIMV